jgi:hypothetical protein
LRLRRFFCHFGDYRDTHTILKQIKRICI